MLRWNKNLEKYVGFPRPFYKVKKQFIEKFKLHKYIPIPWQSKPIFNNKMAVFNVIEEHEKQVYINQCCGFCGIKFNATDNCVRWIGSASQFIPNDSQGPRVFSDTYPLHEACMKQARVFCPFMRLREDKEFETGTFAVLEINAIFYRNTFNNATS